MLNIVVGTDAQMVIMRESWVKSKLLEWVVALGLFLDWVLVLGRGAEYKGRSFGKKLDSGV